MAKLYYRGMAEQNGKPKVGRSARLLGVRLGIDINIEQMPITYLDEQGYLLAESERQELWGELVAVAIRDRKGMSVSLSIDGLPASRKPAKFGGTGKIPYGKLMTPKSLEICKLFRIAQPTLAFCQELQCL